MSLWWSREEIYSSIQLIKPAAQPYTLRGNEVSDRRLQFIASSCLVVGAALGLVGTCMPSASLRGLAWGLDGVALVVASMLLAGHLTRRLLILGRGAHLSIDLPAPCRRCSIR